MLEVVDYLKKTHPLFLVAPLPDKIVLIGSNGSVKNALAKALLPDTDAYVKDLDFVSQEEQFKVFNDTTALTKCIFLTKNLQTLIDPIKYNFVHVYSDCLKEDDLLSLIQIVNKQASPDACKMFLELTEGEFLAATELHRYDLTSILDSIKDIIPLLVTGQYPEALINKISTILPANVFSKLFIKSLFNEIRQGVERNQASELLPLVQFITQNFKAFSNWDTLKLSLIQNVLLMTLNTDSIRAVTSTGDVITKLNHKPKANGFYSSARKRKQEIAPDNQKFIPMSLKRITQLLKGNIVGVIHD